MALYTDEQIIKMIDTWRGSAEYSKIVDLQALYDADNPDILLAGAEKDRRGKTPNNIIPTGYYSTVIDTMAGYMFQDVQYTCETPEQQENLNDIYKANNISVEDMKMGISALAYNKGVEYIYTDSDAEIRIEKLNPANTIIIRDNTIRMRSVAAINYTVDSGDSTTINVMYIEPELERKFTVKESKSVDGDDRALPFKALPVIEYKSQIIGFKAPFEVVLPYITALDALISGNANEIDRLTDALLIIGRDMDEQDLQHMEELKALVDMAADDRAEYITKEMSPEFRKFVSELLIREIHKHSHVIDWYAPDQGQTADASGKALRTRLYDMWTYSKRLELAYQEGAYLRNKAIEELAPALKMSIGFVEVEYNRTMIDDFVDDAVKLSEVDSNIMSYETKREKLGIDEVKELERLETQTALLGVETDFNLDGDAE